MNKPLDAELWPTTFAFNNQDRPRLVRVYIPRKRKKQTRKRDPVAEAAYRLKQRHDWLRCGAVKPRTEAERAIVEAK